MRLGITLTTAVATAVAAALSVATPAQAAPSPYGFSGVAYGTYVTVGSTVSSGPSARVEVGCTTQSGVVRTNTVASVNAAPAASSGTVTTEVRTVATDTAQATKTRSTVQNVNLLNGLITATAVNVRSETYHTSSGFSHYNPTSFVDLVVAGSSVGATVAPNTTITLAGIGYVVLNEQIRQPQSQVVRGLHVYVTQANTLGLAVGTQIFVGHASSALVGPVSGILGGFAYGSAANVGTTLLAGQSFPITMPCWGTNGVPRTNSGLSVSVPGVLSSGSVVNTVKGTVNASLALSETSSEVQNASLLGGLVTADVVKASAHAKRESGGPVIVWASGSFVTNLRIAGLPVSAAFGSTVAVPGVGTLYVGRILRATSNSIEVRMLDLYVLQSNSFGLAVGTNVRVAVANASIAG